MSRFSEVVHLRMFVDKRFGTRQVSLSRLPGWAQPNWQTGLAHESWGYHGDDGRSFASQDTGSAYGQKFSSEFDYRF